jgi:hypothetical protein
MTPRRLAALIMIAIVAIAGGWFAMRMMAPPPSDLDLAREKASAAGLYTVGIEPELQPLEQGPLHSWIVTVRTPAGAPVAEATLGIDGGMPQHGHGLPTAPRSAGHIGDGRYRIEGVRFNMGGWWVLKLTIEAPAGRDTAEFNLVL